MPITGDPNTAVISGNVMFHFDSDFVGRDDPQKTKAYIDEFRKNVLKFWDNKDAPLTFKGNRVRVKVTFGPYVDGAGGWKLSVGEGQGDPAKTLFGPTDITATQKISFVKYASEVGYMFQSRKAEEAAHEFGHMVRLADRYMNGFRIRKPEKKLDKQTDEEFEKRFERVTAPLSRCFSKELDDEAKAMVGNKYNAKENLMSSPGDGQQTVTDRQLSFVFSNSQEPSYPMKGWVFWADDNDKETFPAWLGSGITKLKNKAGVTHMIGPIPRRSRAPISWPLFNSNPFGLSCTDCASKATRKTKESFGTSSTTSWKGMSGGFSRACSGNSAR